MTTGQAGVASAPGVAAAPGAASDPPGAGAGLGVFIAGTVYMDVIFTGLPGAPADGTEIYAAGLSSAPGGRANLAIALSRLGLPVGLCAAFSDDAYGSYLWRTLRAEGIDLSASARAPGWPTPLTVSLSHDADRSFITYLEPVPAGAARQLENSAAERSGPAGPAGCFVPLHREIPAWLAGLRSAGTIVFADVGWDATGRWPAAVLDRLAMVDVFMPNAVEAMSYTRASSPDDALIALGGLVPVCAVKMGADGAIARDARTGERAAVPAIEGKVLDSTGAGDVFDAGFIYATLAGWPLGERLKFANLCAGLSVRHRSGSLGAPGWSDIAAWAQSPDLSAAMRDDYRFVLAHLPASPAAPVARARPTFDDPSSSCSSSSSSSSASPSASSSSSSAASSSPSRPASEDSETTVTVTGGPR